MPGWLVIEITTKGTPDSPKPFILMVMARVREEQLGPGILILNKQGDVGLSQSTGLHRSGRGPRNSQFFQTSRQNHRYWPALRCLDPEMFQVCLWARHNLLKWTLKSDTALVNGPQGQPTGTDLQRSDFSSIFLSFLPWFWFLSLTLCLLILRQALTAAGLVWNS